MVVLKNKQHIKSARQDCNDIWVASCRRMARSSLLYKNIEKQVLRVATLSSGISYMSKPSASGSERGREERK